MNYAQFAYLYDQLMKDVPYDQWAEMIVQKKMQYVPQASRFLDVACGTGELTVRIAEKGFEVAGVDLSEDMLTVAQNKLFEKGYSVSFFQQNMSELEGLGEYDIIGIFCDSLNYLESEEQVVQTFQRVYEHLSKGGMFLFDVHSIYKIKEIFMNQTFGENDEEISYIWHSYQGENPNSVEHDLSFFVLDSNSGQYSRFDELHVQQTYPIEHYQTWLKQCGFDVLEIFADFEDQPIKPNAERLFFVARKNDNN